MQSELLREPTAISSEKSMSFLCQMGRDMQRLRSTKSSEEYTKYFKDVFNEGYGLGRDQRSHPWRKESENWKGESLHPFNDLAMVVKGKMEGEQQPLHKNM